MSNKAPVSAKDFEESVRRRKLEDIVNNIDRSYDEIVNQNVNGKIPEHLFVQYFLPFFSGQVPLKEAHQYFTYWIGIAGTPMNEVNVIDSRGQTLFTVPPIMNSDFVNPAKRAKGMSDIFTEHSLHASHSPASGERYLANELSKRISEFEDNNTKLSANEERWNEIFKRYGIQPVKQADTQSQVNAGNKDDEDTEELIYD